MLVVGLERVGSMAPGTHLCYVHGQSCLKSAFTRVVVWHSPPHTPPWSAARLERYGDSLVVAWHLPPHTPPWSAARLGRCGVLFSCTLQCRDCRGGCGL